MDSPPRNWIPPHLRGPEVRFSSIHLRPRSLSPPSRCSDDSSTITIARTLLSSSPKAHILDSTLRRLDFLARSPPSTSMRDAPVYAAPVAPASGSKAPKVIAASTLAALRSAGEAWGQAIAIASRNHANDLVLRPVRPGTLGVAQMDAQGKRQIVGEAIEVMAEMQRRLMAEFGGELVEEMADMVRRTDKDLRKRNVLVVPEVERVVLRWRSTLLQRPVSERGNALLQEKMTLVMMEGSYEFGKLAGAKWEDEAGTIGEMEQATARLAQKIAEVKKEHSQATNASASSCKRSSLIARSSSVDAEIRAGRNDDFCEFPSTPSRRALSTVQDDLGSSTSQGLETPKNLQQELEEAVDNDDGDEMEGEYAVVKTLAGDMVEVSEEWTLMPDLASSIGDPWDEIRLDSQRD